MDYIFYRMYLMYKKKKDVPIVSGICFVGLVKLAIFFLISISFNMLTGGVLSTKYLPEHIAKLIFLAILLPFLIIDIVRYGSKKKASYFVEKYKESPLNQKIKTWQIFMLPIAIFILSFGVFEMIKRLGLNNW